MCSNIFDMIPHQKNLNPFHQIKAFLLQLTQFNLETKSDFNLILILLNYFNNNKYSKKLFIHFNISSIFSFQFICLLLGNNAPLCKTDFSSSILVFFLIISFASSVQIFFIFYFFLESFFLSSFAKEFLINLAIAF